MRARKYIDHAGSPDPRKENTEDTQDVKYDRIFLSYIPTCIW